MAEQVLVRATDTAAGLDGEAQPVELAAGYKPLGRAFDVAVAASLLALTSPALALSALAVRLTSRGPVLFHQARVGLGGRTFTVLKLRTMVADADHESHEELCRHELLSPAEAAPTSDGIFKLEDDPRVTTVGRLLRRWSLDELPQLINVLRGDMSLVGPRPVPAFEVELYTPVQRQRCRVRPGLTGLWQVSGRNRLNTVQMLELDLAYVRQRSWALDLWILARTPAVLVRGDGAR